MTEKICFVISPIGEPDSPTRKRADDVYYYVIRKVVETFGYTVLRADEINSSGLISPKIIEHLKEDSLVIAYLAENNPNVFFELAIRYVTKKPYIQMKEPIQQLPFDIKDTRTIDLDITELKSVEEAKECLKEQIKSLGKETSNPIVAALDNLTLQGSKDPNENVMAQIWNALSEIRQGMGGTEKMPAEKELEIRQIVEESIGSQMRQSIQLLNSSITTLKNNNKIQTEFKEEIQKINEAYQGLHQIYWRLTERQRGKEYVEARRQFREREQRANMEAYKKYKEKQSLSNTSNSEPKKNTE